MNYTKSYFKDKIKQSIDLAMNIGSCLKQSNPEFGMKSIKIVEEDLGDGGGVIFRYNLEKGELETYFVQLQWKMTLPTNKEDIPDTLADMLIKTQNEVQNYIWFGEL